MKAEITLPEGPRSILYPWQQADWKALRQYQINNAIPHALLITGQPGLAKFDLARLWAKTLLCENILPGSLSDNESKACGQCASCQLFEAGTHPDYMCLLPEAEGKAIKVDQVRDVVAFVSLTRSRGSIRVVVVNPAEAMNVNAANSLLKTLEEPPEHTIVVLVSSKPHQLPATIRSRCQTFSVSAASDEVLHSWLAQNGENSVAERDLALSIAENTPLMAKFYLDASILELNKVLLEDWQQLALGQAKASSVAEKWLKQHDNLPIKLVYTWVIDMIRYQSVHSFERPVDDLEGLFYHTDSRVLKELARAVSIKRLFGIYDRVVEILKLENTSLNNQLQLESLLIQWSLVAQTK